MRSALVLVEAHAGHWLEAALFVPPTLLVLVATVRTMLATRATRRAPDDGKEQT